MDEITQKDKYEIITDIVRLLVIFSIVHVLECFLQEKDSFLSDNFLLMILYFILATIIYHLFIKKSIPKQPD